MINQKTIPYIWAVALTVMALLAIGGLFDRF